MGNFRAAFEAYGADYDGTMRRFLGNEAMYLRVLGMLPRDGSVNRLGDALESGDLGGAFEAAHSLKGSPGTWGSTRFTRRRAPSWSRCACGRSETTTPNCTGPCERNSSGRGCFWKP